MLPIDRTAKTALDANLVNGILSDGPKIKAADDVVYNTIDELYNFTTGLISASTLSRLGIINVKDYNASGLATTFIGSIASGTKVLTLTTTPDFVSGQGINLQGAIEASSLVISAPATVASNVSVTLNGAITNVAVLSTDTAIQVADKIRATAFAGWTTGGTVGTNTVTFTSLTSGVMTDSAYSAGTTGATGTMTTTTQGTADQISTVSSVSGLVVNIADNSTRTIVTGAIFHDDTAVLNALFNTTLTTACTVMMPVGTYVLGSNLTIPPYIDLIMMNGAKFYIKSNVTLTINCVIKAGFHQIFSFESAASIVTTTSIDSWLNNANATKIHQKIKVDWFGAVGDAYPPTAWASPYNTLPVGTDSSDGFRRAFSFAEAAAVKGSLTNATWYLTTKVIVEAAPNSGYYVRGDNILGPQVSSTTTAIHVEFNGNGSMIFHEILASTDALINKAERLFMPHYHDFKVFIYNALSTERLGKFFSAVANVFLTQGVFERISISTYNAHRGYDKIFSLTGTTGEDMTTVRNCYFSAFNYFWYSTNSEAVNWKFENNFIMSNTDNGVMWYISGNYSGMLKIDGNELHLLNAGNALLKTTGTDTEGSVFSFIQNRFETAANDMILFDVTCGTVEVEGLVYNFGNGTAPSTNTRTARVGTKAFFRFRDCIIPQQFDIFLNKSAVTSNGNYQMLKFENCTFLKHVTVGSRNYPILKYFDSAAASTTLINALTNGYYLREIRVESPRSGFFMLPSTVGTIATGQIFRAKLYRNYNGVCLLPEFAFSQLPQLINITSIKIWIAATTTTVIDKAKVSILDEGGGENAALSLALTGTAVSGTELIPAGYMLVIPNVVYQLNASYWLGTTKVTSDAAKVRAWIEIEYRSLNSIADFNAGNETATGQVALI